MTSSHGAEAAVEMPGVPQQIGRLFAEGTLTGLSDAELLGRFASGRDAAAFDALVARHGPMVRSVCRGLLNDPNDAEDAFQATFLILVKRAGSFRGPVALGGWLYLAARRVAIRANVAAARRRAYERRAGQMARTTSGPEPPARDELVRALHEEIARLPGPCRLAVVLCDLQGTPQDRAAAELRLSERTLRRRLSEGRERLKARLDRRGLGLDRALLGALCLREARAAVPAAWRDATVRAALAALEPAAAAGTVSATALALTREVYRTMMIQRVTLASAALAAAGLLAWGASAALLPSGQEAAQATTARAPAPAARETADRDAPRPKPDPDDAAGTVPVRGRVLDPDGRPVAGAEVFVRHYFEPGWNPIDPMAARQKGKVASTGADGRFRFDLDRGASDVPSGGGPGWRKAQIAAAAPGFAPAWVEAGELAEGGEATLRLVRDDVPIRGRIVDAQGRPVAGAVVRIERIGTVKDGVDFDAMLASGEVDQEKIASWYGEFGRAPTWQADAAPLWPGGRNAWTTAADGRFEVRGVGRDRIARLDIHGGGVADGTIDVVARPAKTSRPRPRPSGPDVGMLGREAAFIGTYPQGTRLVGATFDFIAGPAKPLAGVVRLKGSGKPVEGAVVWAADAATHTAVTARTDAAGRFRIEGVPKGQYYQVRVNERPGLDAFLRRWEIVDDTEGLKPLEVALEVPPGVIVTGRLIDRATGRAVPPAQVGYQPASGNAASQEGVSGFTRLADAAFGLTLPPGPGIVYAAAAVGAKEDPYVRARLKAEDRQRGIDDIHDQFLLPQFHACRFIDLPAGAGPVTLDLELTRGLSRAGRLVDPEGRPVAGAVALGLGGRNEGPQTLDAGTFEVRGLEPGHPRLVVFTHKERKLGGSAVLKDEDMTSAAPLEVKLIPACAIVGRLLDDDGLPWAGARLNVALLDRDGHNFMGADETVVADPQGRFRVDGLVPGVDTRVSVEPADRPGARLDGGQTLERPAPRPGEVRDLGDVTARVIPQ